jgi:hypothetical protein
MIERWLNPILQPLWRIKGKILGVKNMKGSLEFDAKRVKGFAQNAKDQAAAVSGKAKQVQAQGAAVAGKAGAVAGQAQGAVGQAQGAAGQAQAAAPQPPKKKKMGLFGKKNVCPNCGQPQDKTWDQCPFCMAGGAAPAPPGPAAAAPGPAAPPAPMKTMAFMAGGGPAGQVMQLLGWLVPIKGAGRGELHTLKPQTVVGKDPTCDVVLADPFMSSRHATIKVANGVWVLEDHSTNGTFVNDKKIKTHELVDNDFLKFGNTLVKFKSL